MEVDVNFLIAVYRSALDDSSALYCSAPITSGRRFICWVRERGNDIRDADHAATEHADEHHARVIAPNLEHASAIIQKLRRDSPIPVIDPTVVPHVPAWAQRDWLTFWEQVITRFVIGIVFVNDWQFSYGCAHEFMHAQANDIPTFAEDGSPLDLAGGRTLIEGAIEEIRSVGGSTARLESSIAVLPTSHKAHSSAPLSLREFLDSCGPYAP